MKWSPVIELRQYTHFPGMRDVLIDLFEESFVESQEAHGMKVIGTFRDLVDPTRFVWIRGFPSADRRASCLNAFYGGPVWKRHREAANATLVDSDNVLLLRPAKAGGGFALPVARPPLAARRGSDRGVIEAAILSLRDAPDDQLVARLRSEAADVSAGGTPIACFVTSETPNDFPVLPVREGEHVLVQFTGFPSRADYDPAERATAAVLLRRLAWAPLVATPQVLALEPTRRSLLAPAACPHA
ncbi:MAG: NIPSNAP family protein [Solirubrobacteraceae bacterium]